MTAILTPVSPPRVALQKEHDAIKIPNAVARWFTPAEQRKAATWLAKHPDLPAANRGPKEFPDPVVAKIRTELRRRAGTRPRVLVPDDDGELGSELEPEEELGTPKPEQEPEPDDAGYLTDEDNQMLIANAAEGIEVSNEIWSTLEAAAFAACHKPRRDRSPERYMAAMDQYAEPYLAVQRGMSLGQAAKKFKIAHIQQHLDNVDRWLASCTEVFPRFNRGSFLVRLERAVETRRRDAGIGAEKSAAEREAFTKPPNLRVR